MTDAGVDAPLTRNRSFLGFVGAHLYPHWFGEARHGPAGVLVPEWVGEVLSS